jgi:hypothetical protein
MADFIAASFLEQAPLITSEYNLSWGEVLQQTDWLLREKGQDDLLLAEQVRDDEQVQSAMQQFLTAITDIKREIVAGGESPKDQEAADWFRDLVGIGATKKGNKAGWKRSLRFNNLLKRMGWSYFYGYGVAELMLSKGEDGKVTLDFMKGGIRVRHRRRFRIDKDLNIRVRSLTSSFDGDVMHPSRVWSMLGLNTDNDDEPYGLGFWHWLYWLVFFKRGGVQDQALSLTVAASPKTEVIYEDAIKKKDAENLALKISQGSKSLAHTQDIVVKYLESTRTGFADFASFVEWCNRAIVETILLQNVTSKEAAFQGDVQQNTKDGLIASCAKELYESFTDEVISKLCFYRFGADVNPPALKMVDPPEDTKVILERDLLAKDLGLKRTEQSRKEVFSEYEEVQADTKVTLLNGAQLTALQTLLEKCAAGAIPPDTAEAVVLGYGVSIEQAQSYIEPIRVALQESKAKAESEAIANDPFAEDESGTLTDEDTKPEQANPVLDAIGLSADDVEFGKGDGYPCGKGYISKAKKCRKGLTGQAKDYAEYLNAKLAGGEPLKKQEQANADAMGIKKAQYPEKATKEAYKKVSAYEDLIVKNDFETVAVFDFNGNQITTIEGGKTGQARYEVEIPESEFTKLQAGIITHNHPRGLSYPDSDPRSKGSSFSPEDIKLMIDSGASEMRAVSPAYRHSIKFKGDKMGYEAIFPDDTEGVARGKLYNSLDSVDKQTRRIIQAKLDAGDLTPAEAKSMHWHEVMKAFSGKHNLDYTRSDRNG